MNWIEDWAFAVTMDWLAAVTTADGDWACTPLNGNNSTVIINTAKRHWKKRFIIVYQSETWCN